MAFRIDGDCLTVNSQYAWVSWIIYGIFVLGFPPAIIAMWQAGPEKIPLWFNLIFTGFFLAVLPYFLREIARARIVRAHIDTASGIVEISKRGLVTRSRETRRVEDIDRIEMQTSENDGEYFSLHVIFRDGGSFAFSHGNYREGMEEERDRFLTFLQKRRPELGAVERFVAE